MRDLTKKQVKLLEGFLAKNKDVGNVEELIEKDLNFYEQLEKINDTEILYQTINSYIVDTRIEEAYL